MRGAPATSYFFVSINCFVSVLMDSCIAATVAMSTWMVGSVGAGVGAGDPMNVDHGLCAVPVVCAVGCTGVASCAVVTCAPRPREWARAERAERARLRAARRVGSRTAGPPGVELDAASASPGAVSGKSGCATGGISSPSVGACVPTDSASTPGTFRDEMSVPGEVRSPAGSKAPATGVGMIQSKER